MAVNTDLCEICDKPLDAHSLEHGEGYCVSCVSHRGNIYEICNYFHYPIQGDPIRCYSWAPNKVAAAPTHHLRDLPVEGDGRVTIPWPNAKDPALYHDQACRHFAGWEQVIARYKKLRGLRFFHKEHFPELLEYIKSNTSQKTDAELMITKIETVLEMLRADLSRTTVSELFAPRPEVETVQKEEIIIEIESVPAATPLFG